MTLCDLPVVYAVEMNKWTKERLEQMIADGVEENLSLDYKRADALGKTDGKKAEITKDVSALANSSGGSLVYGIAEPGDKAKRHLPERVDPVSRTEVSKEWIEQVIQTIQPRIEGVVIHPVAIDESKNHVCYVVEVPQSHTAHQARDHVYYKRHNFNVLPMEDYEVRDVMNRKRHPRIRASVFINREAGHPKPEGVILVRLENVGSVLARYVMAQLEVPISMGGLVSIGKPVLMGDGAEGDCYLLRLTPALQQSPLFPGSDLTLQREFSTNVREVKHTSGRPMNSAKHVKVSIFADEMPPIHAKMDIPSVLRGWTTVENEPLIK